MTASPSRLRHRVGQRIAELDLWRPGHRVAVAVSGGLDSVVLLDLLARTRRWHGGVLEVVTVDHGLRPDSALDADFVLALAARQGFDCRRHEVALPAAADEATARAARFGVFDALPVDRVALAHHADDLVETVLVNLVRGTGLAGLTGMAARRGRFVRPLLTEPRDALFAYARAMGLHWRDDPTNQDPRHLRNRLRHEVLPLLEQIRPGVRRAIARNAEGIEKDEAFLRGLAAAEGPFPDGWPLSFVLTAPDPILRRVLAAVEPGVSPATVAAVRRAAAGEGKSMTELQRGPPTKIQGGGPATKIPVRGGGAFWVGNGVVRHQPPERLAPHPQPGVT